MNRRGRHRTQPIIDMCNISHVRGFGWDEDPYDVLNGEKLGAAMAALNPLTVKPTEVFGSMLHMVSSPP